MFVSAKYQGNNRVEWPGMRIVIDLTEFRPGTLDSFEDRVIEYGGENALRLDELKNNGWKHTRRYQVLKAEETEIFKIKDAIIALRKTRAQGGNTQAA